MARHMKIAAAQLGPLHLSDTREVAARRLVALFREAIDLAETRDRPRDVIGFNIPGSGVRTIAPTDMLPQITSIQPRLTR